jgi:hypothetical protein
MVLGAEDDCPRALDLARPEMFNDIILHKQELEMDGEVSLE